MPYRKEWLPSLTSNQPESLRRVWVSVYFSLTPFNVVPNREHSGGRKNKKTKNNNSATIDFLFRHHLRLCPFFQSDMILTTFTPPLLPFHLHPPPSPLLPNSFMLPKPPPVLCCGFPPCLYFRSLPFFWPNWNCSLWNGKVIYIDSWGIWLAVLSGATCNVTGNKATTNILPPPLSAAKSPPGQRVTSNRNLEKVKVCQEATVNFCWPFFLFSLLDSVILSMF